MKYLLMAVIDVLNAVIDVVFRAALALLTAENYLIVHFKAAIVVMFVVVDFACRVVIALAAAEIYLIVHPFKVVIVVVVAGIDVVVGAMFALFTTGTVSMVYLFIAVIVAVLMVVALIDVVLNALFSLPVAGSILEAAFGRCLNYFIVFALFFSCLIWILVAG
ncbi:MAG: hypothetical protein KDI79_30535 [Anaerolineae bacterium]|nr:hypothetical protein [Anaerolineae bacterium]